MKLFRFLVVGCLVVALVGCNPKPSGSSGGGTGGGERRAKDKRDAQDNKGGGDKTGGEKTAAAAYKDKILGTWELVPPEQTVTKITLEFTKDGKLKTKSTVPDLDAKPVSVKTVTEDGTYAVDGDKLKVTGKAGPGGKDKTQTLTITKLTDKELVTKDEKGRVDTFKKK